MNTTSLSGRQILYRCLLAALAALVVLIAGYHCPMYALWHIRCPGCGMTRALLALMQGKFFLSLRWHALLIPTLAAVCAGWIFERSDQKRAASFVAYAWSGMMILYWIFRLLLVFPYSPLFS